MLERMERHSMMSHPFLKPDRVEKSEVLVVKDINYNRTFDHNKGTFSIHPQLTVVNITVMFILNHNSASIIHPEEHIIYFSLLILYR